MPLIKASSSVIQSIDASQIQPSGAADGEVLQYNQSIENWIPSPLDTTVKSVSGAYQLQLGDQNCVIRVSSPSNVNVTVPHSSLANFSIGTQIVVIQEGAGKLTFVGAQGVGILVNDSRYKTYGRMSGAVLIKLDGNLWFLGGDISDT